MTPAAASPGPLGTPDDRPEASRREEDGPVPHLPLVEDAQDAGPEPRPTWRGWLHAGMTPVALVLGVVLIAVADGTAARVACAVFVASSLLLFGVSAVYHRFDWSPRAKVLLKRMDHANIFLLIAGSYTPITVLALPHGKSVLLLWLVWSGAVLGVLFRVLWIGAPRWLYVLLYLVLGYASLVFIVDFFRADAAMMTLILAGGLAYTVGAVVYALKRPNPWPGRFGFHEIFHAFTLVAFLCHWTGILLVATDPPLV
ncbi:hemolysin III [Clavibacter michiganensis]|uniref:Hemolysin III n=1 Tax=Clavibacter michiganensis TaxID=28447 RepID=A0A2S5VUT3_9MICO|nr:hemolysin III family protein [Clavibacter michiganensis]PPF68291.1 hemolysin III [Clavibacter michiganensis]